MNYNKKTIGIIGGMGPLATIDLYQKIVRQTRADKDSEHIHILIDNDPYVPDRTKAALFGTESPVPKLCSMAQRLESAGAQILALSCNTAHCFYEQIAASVTVPIANMVEETAKAVSRNGIKDIILLATDGTVKTGLYERYMNRLGIDVHYMTERGQALVMSLIYDYVKAEKSDFDTSALISELRRCGASDMPVVLGCTELPIAFEQLHITDFSLVDPTQILADFLIASAGYPLRENNTLKDFAH